MSYLVIPLRVDELYESLCELCIIQPLIGGEKKQKKIVLKQTKIPVWNVHTHGRSSARPFLPYSECFQAKRGRLDAADESQQHIHHSRCVDMFEDQREESLLPTQKTEHLAEKRAIREK